MGTPNIQISREKLSAGRYRFTALHGSTRLGVMTAVKRGRSYTLSAGSAFYGVMPTLKDAEASLRRTLETNLPALLSLATTTTTQEG